MRMWMIKLEKMCRQHLLGEHNEIHKMIGNLRNSRHWAENLTRKGFLEPQNALTRHDELAKEMISRGFNHNSPLNILGITFPSGHVDVSKSMKDLSNRCKNCEVIE